ncbi:MAG: CinA family protein, partial [Campylobacterales bacterium]|nr:CinA family protein [Campylobacterales bacterium]
MKLHLIFVGNKFIYNRSLKEYVLRKVEQRFDFIDFITYFKENDNSLFLYLEEVVNSNTNVLIVTSKINFTTIGKLICTATSDNQILKENMLIPQKSIIFENGTYLTKYKDSNIN